MVDRLKAMADATQAGLKALLSERGASYQSFWIINAVRITSGVDTLSEVGARPEVDRVEPTWTAQIPKPLPGETETIEWNIQHINADDVWNTYNDRGEGVVVANIDTGVAFSHPALKLQYRGLGDVFLRLFPDHNYTWYDPSRICHSRGQVPCDNVGHGTHVMGTMVGDDRGANQIGVAPRAKWIAAKGCETSSCSDFALLKSGQWMLAPTDLNDMNPRPSLRPHVVNNSWGSPIGADEFYRATVNAWVASGIFPVFSNGGGGPGCGTVEAPASYPESYGVGAHDASNVIASFSGRGPSPISPFPIKPDLTAPGVNVRSSVPANGYSIFSGTSMAAPHVAGTVALMWSSKGAPAYSRDIAGTRALLDVAAIDMSDQTCGGSPGDNNVWGEGRLDAFAAVTAARRQLWVRRYTGPGSDDNTGSALGVSPDSSTVFVTGSSDQIGGFDYAYSTVAYDASTGTELWVARYNPGTGDETARALGVSPDGSTVFVTGRSYGGAMGFDYATVAYDASTGSERWVRRYDGPDSRSDGAEALGVSPDGATVFVTGYSVGSTCDTDYATVAYDASTGAERWVARYDGPGDGYGFASALGVSPDGSTVFVTGGSVGVGTGFNDYATVAYEASTGAERWVTRYNGPGNGDDGTDALGVSPDGATVFVTGPSWGGATGYDFDTVAYDASTGAERWVKRYDGPSSHNDGAEALGVSPDGSTVFVTGSTDVDYATVAYDASTGAQLWVTRYNGPGNRDDDAVALGVSPDGSTVFVTGSTEWAGGDVDYATVAYEAFTGAERWAMRYNGNGPDTAYDAAWALGVSPDGSMMFVTGQSEGATGNDFATVAYRS
ncbi:MAG: S8 family serine peptidase [Actinomycetota bacterium]